MTRYGWDPRVLSIMSGDSPHSHNDVIDYIDGGRSSPAPTTSKDPQTNPSALQASVLIEPEKDHEDEEKNICSALLNNPVCEDSRHLDSDQTFPLEELDYEGRKKDKDEERKMNGNADKLDGVLVPNNDIKKPLEEEDDSCLVNCLYYTMQCCECVIV